jgi:hypothetical protein
MDVLIAIMPFCNEQMMMNLPVVLNSVLSVVKSNVD